MTKYFPEKQTNIQKVCSALCSDEDITKLGIPEGEIIDILYELEEIVAYAKESLSQEIMKEGMK